MNQQIQIDGIDVFIEGQGEHTIVMLHGWPDTYRLWDAQVAHLRDRYRCVRFTLSGFDGRQVGRAYSLAEIVAFVKKLIGQVSPDRKVTLLLHDWGCMFGYQVAMQHPELVANVVGVDVGDMQPKDQAPPLKAGLMIMSYFSWLALAWRIGGRLGDRMTRFMARLLRAPANPAVIHCGMNYPYYIAVTGAHGSYKHRAPFLPNCPALYLYGRSKPFMFHSQAWLAQFTARPGCQAIGFDAYHWVMLDQPEQFNRTLDRWLAEQDAASGERTAAGA